MALPAQDRVIFFRERPVWIILVLSRGLRFEIIGVHGTGGAFDFNGWTMVNPAWNFLLALAGSLNASAIPNPRDGFRRGLRDV